MSSTIRDVAAAAGVHISTVSRAFSAPHLVSRETRDRVLEVAERLGYRPNPAARALITGRTHNLGLLVADLANPFFPPLIKAAAGCARERGYHVVVADTDEDPVVEEELVLALARQVDGILLCSPRMTNAAIGRLREEVPLVVVNRVVAGPPVVLMDLAAGVRAAFEHLTALGHRAVVLVTGPRGSWASGEIRRAATAAARSAGVDLTVLGPNPPTQEAGAAAAAGVLRTGATAVLAYNDLVAIGVIEGLVEAGADVPGRISVVGIDDIAPSRMISPGLTTVATPKAAAGRAAVDLLLERGGDGVTARLTLGTELVVRESTAPAPGRPLT